MPGRHGRRARHRDPTPREMVERELAGILRWLDNLKDKRNLYPESWRDGMLRHYTERQTQLEDHLQRIMEAESDESDPS